MVFLVLAAILWAALASAFVGYYYIENNNNSAQLSSANNSLMTVASSYSDATSKYNSLQIEYGALYGSYSYFTNSDYSPLMQPLKTLIGHFDDNFSDLTIQADINGTYNQLLSDYGTLAQKGNISRADFGNLLNEYHELFNLCTIRALETSIGNATTLSVSIGINNGNGTMEWSNETHVPAGTTLFDITQEVAAVKYSYDATEQPGHVFVNSINNVAMANTNGTWYYWAWFYSNDNGKTWMYGTVGCDAWLLTNGSVYEWNYTSY
jgi:hypothetical protein